MRKLLLYVAIFALPISAMCQSFIIDGKLPVYNDSIGYGLDFGSTAADVVAGKPVYFSVKLPDGNYHVAVEIGSKKRASSTTIRTDSRRLMLENIDLQKGKSVTREFVTNMRTPAIKGGGVVLLKPQEDTHKDWDDRLTFEFTGTAPAVKKITITPDTTATTIYLCGNSTVVDQDQEPWASWGQMIPRWIDSTAVVSNHAESGLATSTFISQKRLDKIMSTLKPGDYVFVEFGHNDMKEKGPGDGAYYNFAHNLKIFIDRVRSKGGNIVFCTPTQRRTFDETQTHIVDSHRDYPAAMREVAQRENVPVIELNNLTRTFFNTLGYENSKKSLVHYPANTFPGQTQPLADNTHFNPYGAYEIAKMVAAEIQRLNLPIASAIRSEFKGFDPAKPDSFDTFVWIPANSVTLSKPDGN